MHPHYSTRTVLKLLVSMDFFYYLYWVLSIILLKLVNLKYSQRKYVRIILDRLRLVYRFLRADHFNQFQFKLKLDLALDQIPFELLIPHFKIWFILLYQLTFIYLWDIYWDYWYLRIVLISLKQYLYSFHAGINLGLILYNRTVILILS